ncbi:hypothetical protein Droror1_Dr00010304 [Drosera rotundifolia]
MPGPSPLSGLLWERLMSDLLRERLMLGPVAKALMPGPTTEFVGFVPGMSVEQLNARPNTEKAPWPADARQAWRGAAGWRLRGEGFDRWRRFDR